MTQGVLFQNSNEGVMRLAGSNGLGSRPTARASEPNPRRVLERPQSDDYLAPGEGVQDDNAQVGADCLS